MAKRMLIDATHAEETRVVVLDGARLEDFDVETSTKRQLKGNIYLAKVVRVEPSLQAAFVEYGGNRHGFLAFSEIHPDYYQIPVADRQRLLAMQAEQARREEEEEDRAAEAEAAREELEAAETPASAEEGEPSEQEIAEAASLLLSEPFAPAAAPSDSEEDEDAPIENGGSREGRAQPAAIHEERVSETAEAAEAREAADQARSDERQEEPPAAASDPADAPAEPVLHGLAEQEEPEAPDASFVERDFPEGAAEPVAFATEARESEEVGSEGTASEIAVEVQAEAAPVPSELAAEAAESAELRGEPTIAELPPPETVGGDADGSDEARDRRLPPRFVRNYKIQEVIHRRQILLVQVVKEERGTKGAALTTYLSLAGRYCVLMPNSPRGGGISRKITSPADRRRLKEIMSELDIPNGMGLIVRTAGANRPKPEIKRDCEYLMRLWDDIREHTLKSVAPSLVYEEASLIKRAIRDVYSRDVDEVLVDGEEGWKAARDFMRMLMPSHAKKVQLWRDGGMPLFAKQQVEAQLDAMLTPTVQLRSGGYLVINQTEALVAIDVNSGRSTRERNIEETALRTNLEAADEVARQLRLRDLAGLIVIDFIDMEARKHNAMVERRLKDALKNDRARIQVGHISHFGLLEMSRQRLRPSLAETSFVLCPHCGGTGHVRGTEGAAIHVLRHIEEEGARRRAAEVVVYVATQVAMYILNHKRDRLREIETRYGMRVVLAGDDSLIAPQMRLDRVRPQIPAEAAPAAIIPVVTAETQIPPPALEAEEEDDETEDDEEGAEAVAGAAAESGEEGDRRRRRRRRRRRGGRRDEASTAPAGLDAAETGEPTGAESASDEEEDAAAEEPAEASEAEPIQDAAASEEEDDESGRGRRRGRRGGRRRRREGDTLSAVAEPGAEQPDLPYVGPTPANPFAGQGYDIFEVIERAEEQSEFSGSQTASPSRPPREERPAAVQAPAESTLAHASAEAEPAGESEPVVVAALSEPELKPESESKPEAELKPEPEPAPDSERKPEPARLEEAAAEPLAAEPEIGIEPPAAANDAAPHPAIQPIVIGSEEAPAAEKKRGWWRR